MTFRTSLLIPLLIVTPGCDTMKTQPYKEPLSPSSFFSDGGSARPLPPGTVARGHLRADDLLFRGMQDGEVADVLPFKLTQKVLDRGQGRFQIYCTPCHDAIGTGNGIVVQRGFVRPPSYHIPRLRSAPLGHFFQVITNGWGAMYSYADRVSPEDRWAIAAYIRTLQFSQSATLDDAPPADRERLKEDSSG